MNQERLREQGQAENLEALLHAFLLPALRLTQDPAGGTFCSKLVV